MDIEYRPIGNSGINIFPIGLGSMPLSLQNRPPKDKAIQVIHEALEAGMNFIDTADVYCIDHRDIGYCEQLIHEALTLWKHKTNQTKGNNQNKDQKNEHIVVATKGGLERPNGAWTRNGKPSHLIKACEASLKALDVDCIEIYQLHAPDPEIPYLESIGTLRDLQRNGKIKHIGISNVTVAHIKQAQTLVNVVSVQNRCNPFDLRSFHDGVIQYCEAQNIAFLPWSPVGGSSEKNLIANESLLKEIAKQHQATPFQIALAWLLTSSKNMIPIPGASKIESATSSAVSVNIVLTKEEITRLNNHFGL